MSTTSPSMPCLHVLALRVAQGVGAVVAGIEFEVQVIGLEAQHGTQRRGVGGESTIGGADVFAVGDGGLNIGFARGGADLGDGGGVAPGAVNRAAAKNPLRPDLGVHERA